MSRSFEFESDGVQDIPLPDEIPPPPQIKFEISQSLRAQAPGTFESLLGQNQDLMNRLTLALRRTLELENQLGKLIERNRYLELQAQAIHSEMSQMSALMRERDVQAVTLTSERDHAEKIFAEIQAVTEEKTLALFKTEGRLSRYRTRIRRQVRPLVERFRNEVARLRADQAPLSTENYELKDKVERFKQQLAEAYAHIQAQHKEFEDNQREITTVYEAKIEHYIRETEIEIGRAHV